MHPADELRAVRAEIARLRARADRLRGELIGGDDRAGARWHAVVETRLSRRIDPAALPLSVRADPRSWTVRARTAVRLLPVPGAPPAAEPPWLDALALPAPRAGAAAPCLAAE
jgi:hypothetical protein